MRLGQKCFVSLPLIMGLACAYSHPGPDKTIGGGVVGSGWGAGMGAVIGHQVSYAGEGAAVGAGFGALSGLMSGYGFDALDNAILEQEEELASLRAQTFVSGEDLRQIQRSLDDTRASFGGGYEVFFDHDSSSLRSGSIENLEALADAIKMSTIPVRVEIVGHADDGGSPEYNARLAEARARTVSSYLGSRGVAMDQIHIRSAGSTRPLLSNTTAEGRQFNRRVEIYLSH